MIDIEPLQLSRLKLTLKIITIKRSGIILGIHYTNEGLIIDFDVYAVTFNQCSIFLDTNNSNNVLRIQPGMLDVTMILKMGKTSFRSSKFVSMGNKEPFFPSLTQIIKNQNSLTFL